MKYSCFNSILSLSHKTDLLYNSFSDSFLVVKSGFKQIIKNDIGELEKKNSDLYLKLVETGFYVPDDVNESERLDEFSRKIMYNDSDYFIIINPTLACNFQCWYCYENHKQGSKMSEDVLNRVYLLFNNIIKENPQIKSFPIAFFGGEPLICYKSIVRPVVEYHHALCRKNNIRTAVSFTSNGGLLTAQMIEELAVYEPVSFQITLDGAQEQHDNVRFSGNHTGSYRSILAHIKLLLQHRIFVRIRINYTAENLSSLKNIVDDIRDIPQEARAFLEIDFHWVWQQKTLSQELGGIRQVVDYFADNGFKVIFNDIDLLRHSCYADRKNTAVINYNGDVYKCTAHDFIPQQRDGYLDESGHIVWLNPEGYRYTLRFKNEKCRTCRIAPLCAGGCTNYMLRKDKAGESYCLYEKEERIDELILDRFDMYIRKGQLNG